VVTDTGRRTKGNGTLEIDAGSESDAGHYHCTAENSAGRAVSAPAILQESGESLWQ